MTSHHSLVGRTAVVIGGGSGVGRGIALGLAAERMRVVVADIDLPAASAVVSELAARNGVGIAARVNSTDRGSLQVLAERAAAEFGAIHVLVNTVGVIYDCKLTDATDEDWAWMFELNVMAQVRAVDVFLPALRAGGDGAHIVLTASAGGLASAPGMPIGLYIATKHALVGYGEMLRLELEPEGVGISMLCPTGVVGNLAATSARERFARLGKPVPKGSGEPPNARARMPNEHVGPLVARAIRENRFYVLNRADVVLAAVDERHRRLREDAAAIESPT